MRKISTITVSVVTNALKRGTHFKVQKVTDSVDFLPGQYLDGDKVADLCRSLKWKVTIVGKAA